MKHFVLSTLAVAALASPAAAQVAQESSSATATASARIIEPMAVSKTRDMQFGNFVANSGGTVTVAPASGARTKSGSVVLLAGTAPAAAQFAVTADDAGGATYRVVFTKTDLTDGTNTLEISDIDVTSGGVDVLASAGTGGTGTSLVLTGDKTLDVGATIDIGASDAPGAYAGSITATATYE